MQFMALKSAFQMIKQIVWFSKQQSTQHFCFNQCLNSVDTEEI